MILLILQQPNLQNYKTICNFCLISAFPFLHSFLSFLKEKNKTIYIYFFSFVIIGQISNILLLAVSDPSETVRWHLCHYFRVYSQINVIQIKSSNSN